MTPLGQRVAENLAAVRQRIAHAAKASGRDPGAVTLVGVTKYVSAAAAKALVEAGCLDLGESRPQELWAKAAELENLAAEESPSPGELRSPPSTTGEGHVRWHFIGHLQRNKLRRTLPLLHLVQSVDSQRLLETIDEEAVRLDRRVDVLVELNVSGDTSKTGLPVDQLDRMLQTVARLTHVSVRGLMGMASLDGGPEAARRDFARLRELRDQAARNLPAGVSLDELSMGMSEDFEIAIAEGATMVRVGSALFEGIEEHE
jgi:PLP dependent protein